ncbi:glycosyltransferase [Williamsia maris]|uniref:UDP:flavonoid glycosyltransferase YjiC, YdhE family n=1 Tax=Williamsia maris TaxID=72806 RepID=A0ABT1H7V3_9NOCA|nr:glycosyltransferase [Williamsia maris]MCP2174289.1 UDP:flavonoid glycosyltransferase YjiC, YdhE family [Williamsia maris]
MELVLSFNGSRGDVQPGVALAVAVAARGHTVRMAVPPNLVDFARAAGVRAEPCGADTRALLGSDLVTRDLKSRNPVSRMRAVAEVTHLGSRAAAAELVEICTGADAIVGGSVGQERSLTAAEALGVPYLPVHYCPMRTNGAASPLAQWGLDPPASVSRASWRLLEQILWQTSRSGENRLRSDLGLRPARRSTARRIADQGVPEIQAYDPALFPGLSDEWGASRPLVGFLNLTGDTRALVGADAPSTALNTWLDGGEPPVYVGFGSMTVDDPARLADAIVRGTQGHRVLVATGWSDFMSDAADDRIHVVGSVDHDTVLPRCSVAVHHGGAGSTAAGLRAGLPAVICWLGADQPMWGQQVTHAGAGISGPLAALTETTLRDSIDTVLAPASRAAAQAVSRRLIDPVRAVDAAVEIIESTVLTRG